MGEILASILQIYMYVVIAYAVFSWLFAFNIVNPRNQLVATIYEVCWKLVDPVLSKIRQVIPTMGGMDFSPIVLLFAVSILSNLVRGM
ncbi:YggT family protein [Cohaesibacter celericrescens]|nr:YggT family protein [Cohaesibacter celericrescens]